MSEGAVTNSDGDIVRSWQEWEIDGRERKIILCVETPLELRPGHPGFDRAKLDRLIDHATSLMHASSAPVDSIRILPAS